MASRDARAPRARRSDRGRRRQRGAALTLAERRRLVLERLAAEYGGLGTALRYGDVYQLLVAVMLSAQSTDARVNLVTPRLFESFPTVRSLAVAKPEDVEPFIKSVGLYHSKAKNLVNAARAIASAHAGAVPRTLEELIALPGVGRKTANVVLSVAFRQAAIAVDTHVFRVANRLGLARGKTPAIVERRLMRVVPQRQWSQAHHWLIHHGRQVCHARRPACASCVVGDLCPSRRKFLT